jgi:head-tail adaptor
MFERTFSFWRRLVGKEQAGATAAQEERRLWVRYPADLETSLHLDREPPLKAAARIRDLSRGGASLLVDVHIEPGQMVTLELPARADGFHSILACVVRAVREPSGQWVLGCVFSRELAKEDLARLGARRVGHEPTDQRAWMRFPVEVRATYRDIGAASRPARAAQVLDLSANGIGLLAAECVEAGTVLDVDLTGKDGSTFPTILACVVRVQEQGAGQWKLGCNFIRELSEKDLQALV